MFEVRQPLRPPRLVDAMKKLAAVTVTAIFVVVEASNKLEVSELPPQQSQSHVHPDLASPGPELSQTQKRSYMCLAYFLTLIIQEIVSCTRESAQLPCNLNLKCFCLHSFRTHRGPSCGMVLIGEI